MIYLILSILCSSFIFIIFKLFAKYKVDTLQAIVFNYVTACTVGFLMFGKDLKPIAFENLSWVPAVIFCGILFISSFIILGISSQKNGVAMTSVASKMSMAISMVLMITWYGEPVSILKVIGILMALGGVVFMSMAKGDGEKTGQKTIVWMLIYLFISGGILDFTLNFAQNNLLQDLPPSLFSAIGFGISAIIGSIIIGIAFLKKTKKFEFKNVIAGIGLGIPNYFSIFLIMASYKSCDWTDSTILAIANVSVVLLSALTGLYLFKEKLNKMKIFGLISSVFAIVILYLSSL